ncbi:MAG: UDP-2,3-diacylglucosamine diphosphatase [Gammaproteobacteria bacterium]|nr:UDP-2,3-diacylglucosamine diphosphatase [Gammaproteobacteria bacterium]
MNRIFLSDLHLDCVQSPAFTRFSECLAHEAGWADEIFVLGDLFEAWIGDDDDADLAEGTCSVLRDAAGAAVVLLMPGNRDFLWGPGFASRTGAILIDDPHRTKDGLILTHGDSLCTEDTAYVEFRRTVRSDAWRRKMLARPLEERRRIGAQMRAESAAANANKADNIMDVTPAAVTGLMQEQAARTLIHGHTHRPGVHVTPEGIRYVLGSWQRCGWVLRERSGHFDLECFSLAAPYRSPD